MNTSDSGTSDSGSNIEPSGSEKDSSTGSDTEYTFNINDSEYKLDIGKIESVTTKRMTKAICYAKKQFDRTKRRFGKIYIKTSDTIYKFIAIGDCCSTSWFEETDDPDNLVGKTITKCDRKTIKLSEDKDDDNEVYLRKHIYTFTLENKEQFSLILYNSSNGYYDGWINLKITSINPIIPNVECQLIIVVGLPGSGKSHYLGTLNEDWKIYDDFYDVPTNILFIIEDLSKGRKVAISDPRLSSWTSFEELYSKLKFYIKNKSQIKVVLFKYDLEKCLANLNKRDSCTEYNSYCLKLDQAEYSSFSDKLNKIGCQKIILDVYSSDG